MSLVHLHKPSAFKDWRRRRRVEVLHETIRCFEMNEAGLSATAMTNLARWARETHSGDVSCQVLVIEGDALDTVYQLTRTHGKLFACLNMANASYPGGGYTTGCAAQEENMARRTQLHSTFDKSQVEQRGREIVYTEAMCNLISGKSGVVYLSAEPLVCIRGSEEFDAPSLGYKFLPCDQIFPFLELRSAAVNRKKRASSDASEMEKRIEAQFATLVRSGVRYVVFSAFGCGAFGNDPAVVASIYKSTIDRYKASLSVVAFAIFYAGHGESNYDVFKSILDS